jgi:dCTP deaminase
VRASFLPGPNATVQDKIERMQMHSIDLTKGAVLERGCVYIVPLLEHLNLSSRIAANANPKSSTGRLDIFTRLITDHATEFDNVEAGYRGPLYLELSPRTFSVVVHRGSRLAQMRFRRGSAISSKAEIERLHAQTRLIDRDWDTKRLPFGVPLTVDLAAGKRRRVIGYRARRHSGVIDVDKVSHYAPLDFWEPVARPRDNMLILDPDEFYILASKEAVTVPPTHAAEMVAYDTSVGEFRVHYAGFFDPGFGHADFGGHGSRAVLEVRSHEVPFAIEEDQVVGRLIYWRLTDIPDRLYGEEIGSSYQSQGLALSKQFKR